jgi:hypothetical protein
VESFKGRFRDECPNEHLFSTLPEAAKTDIRRLVAALGLEAVDEIIITYSGVWTSEVV